MSSGHRHKHDLTETELDDLLRFALADPRVKAAYTKPFKVVKSKDVPLLGSSSINRATVFFDRHFKLPSQPYGVLIVQGRKLNVIPGLIRHERLEIILENIFGWPYGTIAHPVAQHFEEKYYRAQSFDPREVEKAFAPFIRSDELEPLSDVPTDLDLRPMLEDKKLLQRTREAQNRQKREQASVRYTPKSTMKNKRCELCKMFITKLFGGPACIGVKDDIEPFGICRRFRRGRLDLS